MSEPELAGEAVLDSRGKLRRLLIDGVEFPYMVSAEVPPLVGTLPSGMPFVQVAIMVDQRIVIHHGDSTSEVVQAPWDGQTTSTHRCPECYRDLIYSTHSPSCRVGFRGNSCE